MLSLFQKVREQGEVIVDGERIRYEILILDCRADTELAENQQRGGLNGNVIVFIPGHGQMVNGPRNLLTALTVLSRSKVLWSIDITPPEEGDRTKAKALALIVRQRVAALADLDPEHSGNGPYRVRATLIGYSHGGGEALLSANHDPEQFPQVVGLCPTGLIDRSVSELVWSFVLEALRIVWASLRAGAWGWLLDTLRVGTSAAMGIVLDLIRTGRPRRLIEDIRWAGTKAPGAGYQYPGEVVLLLGEQDSVIDWSDVFPGCDGPEGIPMCLPDYQSGDFPNARRLEFHLAEGNHLFPEAKPWECARIALNAVGQLDEAVSRSGPKVRSPHRPRTEDSGL